MFPGIPFYSGEFSHSDITEGFLRNPHLGDRVKIIEFFTHIVSQAEVIESECDSQLLGVGRHAHCSFCP